MSTIELQSDLRERIESLGPWFHDLDLRGVRTAPQHPLGGFLLDLWSQVESAFPADMTGKTVLDIGCNAGFYSLRLHARGATDLFSEELRVGQVGSEQDECEQ